MKSSGQAFICHGFNNYCESPKFIGEHLVMFRTAVVIKERDFDDVWDVHDDLFWRMVNVIAAELADRYRIKVIDQSAPTFDSVLELRAWQSLQKETDSEFVIDPPAEIDFFSAGGPVCHMELEDWSDIVKYEPYACSFTFSFYSHDENVDAKIVDVLQKCLSSEEAISGVLEVYEAPRPKWYWPILNVIKSDTFLIYVGLIALILFALVMIITSPSGIKSCKTGRCRHDTQLSNSAEVQDYKFKSSVRWKTGQTYFPMARIVRFLGRAATSDARGTDPCDTVEVIRSK